MLPLQRHEIILRQLEMAGAVRTTELASLLEVTDETIRRDLDVLAKSERLIRIHGGARLPHTYRTDLPLKRRQSLEREAKEQIAKAALNLIQPGQVIFLDASSTALTLIEHLPEVELTVITNALNVISALDSRSRIRVVGTGGTYERISRSFVGNAAFETVKRHHIHRMFLGCNGIEPQRGASEVNVGQAALKERIVELSEETIILADHTKLGVKSDNFFGQPKFITLVVTDIKADPAEVEALRQADMEVLIAD